MRRPKYIFNVIGIGLLVAIFELLLPTDFLGWVYGLLYLILVFLALAFAVSVQLHRNSRRLKPLASLRLIFPIVFFIGLTILPVVWTWQGIQDMPLYLSGHYRVISGTPSAVSQGSARSNVEYVTINGHSLKLIRNWINMKDYKNFTYTFDYLPHTGYVLRWTADSLK